MRRPLMGGNLLIRKELLNHIIIMRASEETGFHLHLGT